MLKVTRETEKYRSMVLYETNKTRIKLVEYKPDRMLDRVQFIRIANISMNGIPEIITVFRYEDEQLIEDMKRMYGAE